MNFLLVETSGEKGFLALAEISNPGQKGAVATLKKVKTWEGAHHSAFITKAFESFKPFKPFPSVLALSLGPGRFTGLRVGISFAKTLSFVCSVPVYPVCSLKILAYSGIDQDKPVLVLQNAFKNSLYTALYQKKAKGLKELISPKTLLLKDLPGLLTQKPFPPAQKKHPLGRKKDFLCLGDGYRAYENALCPNLKARLHVRDNVFPSAKCFMELLRTEFDPVFLTTWKNLNPVYLRSPVKLLSKKPGPMS